MTPDFENLIDQAEFNVVASRADTRTPEQVKALRELVERMHAYFPKALVVGHHDLNPMKACPCFDAVAEYRDLQP